MNYPYVISIAQKLILKYHISLKGVFWAVTLQLWRCACKKIDSINFVVAVTKVCAKFHLLRI